METNTDNEPIEIDFDAMSEGCMSNMLYGIGLMIVFLMALILQQ